MLEQTKGDKHGFELKVNLNWKSISLEAMDVLQEKHENCSHRWESNLQTSLTTVPPCHQHGCLIPI